MTRLLKCHSILYHIFADLFITLLYQNNQPISKYLLQNGTWYWVEVQAKPRFEHHPDPVVYVNIHDSTVLACTVCIFCQWLLNGHINKHSFDQSFSSIMSIEHEPIGRVMWLDCSVQSCSKYWLILFEKFSEITPCQ